MDEMNRRLRRRMVTRGGVSIDVEDGRSPNDWPLVSDVTVDMLKHSVHFPLEPRRVTWPGGEDTEKTGTVMDRSKAGVMRILNIVSLDCRLLASRERCPFLVHVEVAETGMEGSDARLYAAGAKGLGTTFEESMSMPVTQQEQKVEFEAPFPIYRIPSELLPKRRRLIKPHITAHDTAIGVKKAGEEASEANPQEASSPQYPSRGGSQSDGEGIYYHQEEASHYNANPYDVVRQQQYEQLYNQMQTQQQQAPQQHQKYITETS